MMEWTIAAAMLVTAESGPTVFSKLSVDEAIARSASATSVIYATADWCGPCQQMKRTTWVDPDVEAFFKSDRVILALDVDDYPAESQRLGISAMPTMIAFRGREEVDRIVGYRSADNLLSWLQGVEANQAIDDKPASQRLIAEDRPRAEVEETGETKVRDRRDLAKSLVRKGDYARATEEYLWLWDNMLEHAPSMSGVRRSFMASEMQDLAERSPQAKRAFTAKRNSIRGKLGAGDVSWENLADWIELNKIVDDPSQTLAWVDRMLARGDSGMPSLRRNAFRLRDLLIRHDRIADYGKIENAVERAKFFIMVEGFDSPMAKPGHITDEQWQEMNERLEDSGRKQYALLYEAALAADRVEHAREAASVILNHNPSDAMKRELLEAAIRADRVLPEHAEWAEEIGDSELINQIRRPTTR